MQESAVNLIREKRVTSLAIDASFLMTLFSPRVRTNREYTLWRTFLYTLRTLESLTFVVGGNASWIDGNVRSIILGDKPENFLEKLDLIRWGLRYTWERTKKKLGLITWGRKLPITIQMISICDEDSLIQRVLAQY